MVFTVAMYQKNFDTVHHWSIEISSSLSFNISYLDPANHIIINRVFNEDSPYVIKYTIYCWQCHLEMMVTVIITIILGAFRDPTQSIPLIHTTIGKPLYMRLEV